MIVVKIFPILASGVSGELRGIPWDLITPHEAQAKANHCDQSLQRLSERCGLSASEAVAVLEDRPWRKMDKSEADKRLRELVNL